MEPSVVTLSHVSKSIDGRDLVSDLTFDVPQGNLFGLIGPSGGGKTTAVRLMIGIFEPSQGVVRVFGTEAAKLSLAQRERIGYMPQHPFLYPTLTASENWSYVAGIYGIGWWRRRSLIPRVLREVELWDARDRMTQDLSGGMLRRLQLAAVILHEPALVFVDEPMAGLDPLLRDKMWGILRRLCDRGSTVVLTTQITQEAERCDRIALLKEGKLIAVGSPDQLCRRAFQGEMARILIGGRMREAISALWGEAGVSEVVQKGENAIRIVTSGERRAAERAADVLRLRGIEVLAIEPANPSFDEVFERLVTRA